MKSKEERIRDCAGRLKKKKKKAVLAEERRRKKLRRRKSEEKKKGFNIFYSAVGTSVSPRKGREVPCTKEKKSLLRYCHRKKKRGKMCIFSLISRPLCEGKEGGRLHQEEGR